jgi:hypothetical protein
MPPSPVSGKPRSSAAIGNTMTIAAQHGDVEMTDNPVRFRVPTTTE